MRTRNSSVHLSNVVRFESLISICEEIGDGYAPASDAITIASMKAALAKSMQSVQNVIDIKQEYDEMVDARSASLKLIKNTAEKIFEWLKSAETPSQVKLRAEDALMKIRARRTTRIKAIAARVRQEQMPPTSLQQQTTDFIIANYTTLLLLVSSHDKNKELDQEAINHDFNTFKMLNEQVVSCEDRLEEARLERTSHLYDVDAGVVKISSDAREYIQKLLGYSSPEYKKMAAIKFRTIMGD